MANARVKPKLADRAEEYAKLIIEEAEYDQEGEIKALTTTVLVRLGLKDAHATILGAFLGGDAVKVEQINLVSDSGTEESADE